VQLDSTSIRFAPTGDLKQLALILSILPQSSSVNVDEHTRGKCFRVCVTDKNLLTARERESESGGGGGGGGHSFR